MLGDSAAFLLPVATHVVVASCKGALAIALLLLCRKVFAGRLSARFRHGLWLVVLVSLLLPVGFDLPIRVPVAAVAVDTAPFVAEIPAVEATATASTGASPSDVLIRSVAASLRTVDASSGRIPLQSWLALLWFVAVAMLATVPLLNLYRYRRIVARAVLVSGPVLDLLLQCRQQMGVHKSVRLLETTEVATPAVSGWWSPTLLLPPGLHERLGAAQLRHVLLHELAHVQRHDILVNWVATGAQILHWFNPLVWYGMRVMRADMEQACDARVLGHLSPQEHADYGRTLIGVLDAFPGHVPAQALGVVESRAQLKERITMIAKFSSRKIRSPVLAAVLAAVLLLGLASVAVTQPRIGAEGPASRIGTVIGEAPRRETPVRMSQAAQPAAAAVPSAAARRSAEPAVSEPAPRAVIPFTVRIIPPDTTGASEASGEFLEKYFRGLARRLRAVPGLTLLTPESPGADGDIVNYEVGVEAGFIEKIGVIQQIGLRTKTLTRLPVNTSIWQGWAGPLAGVMFTMASSNRLEDTDPELLLDRDVDSLRVRTFPSDPVLLQELQARIADPRVESRLRQLAMDQLLLNHADPRRSAGEPDPAVVRAGVEFATTAPETVDRRVAWRKLRDTRSPELIAPLIQAMRTEKDDDVRLFLATGIAQTYIDDPRVRMALESVARSDARPLIRMAAQHELSGDNSWKQAVWNDYVMATLKNPRLSDAARLEPFAYLELCGEFPQGQAPLDDEAIRILGSLLARVKSDSSAVSSATFRLGRAQSPVAYDLVAGLLQGGAGQSQAIRTVREQLLSLLSGRAYSDPGVRALFEDVAARDPDAGIRGRARMRLDFLTVTTEQTTR